MLVFRSLLRIFAISLLIVFSTKAQKPSNFDSLPYTQQMDVILGKVPKTSMQTNILYDRVFPWGGLQVLNNGIDTLNRPADFIQKLMDLQAATLPNQTNAFTDKFTLLEELSVRYKYSDTIPVVYMMAEFDQLREDAISNNILRFDSDSLLEPSTNNQSPFNKRYIQLCGLIRDGLCLGKKNYVFKLFSNYNLNNTGASFVSVQIEIDGQSILLNTNNPIKSIDFEQIGVNTNYITLKMGSYKNDIDKISFQKQKFNRQIINPFNNCFETLSLNGENFNTQTYNGLYPNHSITPRVDLSILYGKGPIGAGCDRKIDKPIFILDGFDPGDKRRLFEIEDTSKTLYELMDYLRGIDKKNLMEDLVIAGYDVIILNFPKTSTHDYGATFIELNAMATIETIKYVNNQLRVNNSTNQIVILGPSMGGLISRYALAYMEKKEAETGNSLVWGHNTRLYVSFDSPHLGANVPLSLQYLLKELHDNHILLKPARDAWNDKLNSIAAKQMILLHRNEAFSGGTSDRFRNVFINNLNSNGLLNSNGFPVNLRKVTISNGSISGKIQADRYGILTANNNSSLFKFMVNYPFNSWIGRPIFYNFEGRAVQSTSAAEILNISMRWIVRTQSRSFRYNSSLGSLDIHTGGNYHFTNELITTAYGIANTRVEIKRDNTCFIPTKSALAFNAGLGNGNNGLSEDLRHRDLVCTNEIPFDEYYVEDENTDHVSLSYGMVDFLFRELNNDIRLQRVFPNGGLPQTICNNQQLGVPNVFPNNLNYTYNWTFTPSNIASFNNPAIAIPIVNNVNTSGAALLTYEQRHMIRNIECIVRRQRNVWVGKAPRPTWNFSSPVQVCLGERRNLWFNIPNSGLPSPNSLHYRIGIVSCNQGSLYNAITIDSIFNNQRILTGVSVSIRGNNAGTCTLNVKTKSPCGWDFLADIPIIINGNCAFTTLPPNIVNGRIGTRNTNTIQAVVLIEAQQIAGPGIETNLYDARNNKLLTTLTDANGIATFSVANLPEAVYYIDAQIDATTKTPQAQWIKIFESNQDALISPNPLVKEVDTQAELQLLSQVDISSTLFKYYLKDNFGTILDSNQFIGEKTFVPIDGLEAGQYFIDVYNENGIVSSQNLHITITSAPALRILSNPVGNILNAQIDNYLAGKEKVNIFITAVNTGDIVITETNLNASGFSVDVSNLPVGAYVLSANDGIRHYSLSFLKQ